MATTKTFLPSGLFDRRYWAVTLLGFSSGLPVALVGGTLQAWMASSHVDYAVIGVFSLVGLPYTLKFIWAPLMDRFVPPFLGRRRGWIAISQLGVVLGLSVMAFCEPAQTPFLMGLIAFLVAFAGASQDMVIDAYRTETLDTVEYGTGSALSTLGYRVAMIVSGSIALILSDHFSWRVVYLFMAAAIAIGLGTTFLAPEPKKRSTAPLSLQAAVIEPFQEFFKRKRSYEILAFITLYKLDVVVALALMTPFLMDLGFSRTEIGTVTKGFGIFATLAGTLVGGIWMRSLGIRLSLWIFGALQGISGICFYILAHLGHHMPMMIATIATENFFSGMGNAVYAAFLMSLCHPKYTVTQLALLTSLMALSRTLIGAPAGWLFQQVGWSNYFLIALFLAIPSFIFLARLDRWLRSAEATATSHTR